MTQSYLKILTGISEKHEFEWWSVWWDKNRDKLVWKRDEGKFEIKE